MRPVIVIVYFLISNWTHWAPSAVAAQQGPGHPIGKWSGLTSRREELRPLFQSQQFCQYCSTDPDSVCHQTPVTTASNSCNNLATRSCFFLGSLNARRKGKTFWKWGGGRGGDLIDWSPAVRELDSHGPSEVPPSIHYAPNPTGDRVRGH